MKILKMTKDVEEITLEDGTKVFTPVMYLGERRTFFSHQGSVVYYDTVEEALEHIEE